MTAFVILAAGRGSRLGRIGDELPKALLPIDGQAVLSRQFALAPPDARLIVVAGYRALQIREYVHLAHPGRDITIVDEVEWGRGPGASLLEAKTIVGDDDMIFVACDTLWDRDDSLWTNASASWLAVAPIPAGTPPARWCRVVPREVYGGLVTHAIHDKTPDVVPNALCWTALAYVASEDLETFWDALSTADTIGGEIQLSSGLTAILRRGEPLWANHINWLDVGDEQAFRNAVATYGGYDPLKPDQVTYVMPQQQRVVKFHVNRDKVRWRAERAKRLGDTVPHVDETINGTMIGYNYVSGVPSYAVVEYDVDHVGALLDWWGEKFWATRAQFDVLPQDVYDASIRFYHDKTFERVESLDPALRSIALDAVTRVDWDALLENVVPGTFHGDFTFANVITGVGQLTAVDWREDYAGVTEWGDLRYDLGKLLCATRFHWQRAAYGDFRRWDRGPAVEARVVRDIFDRFTVDLDDVRRIAALCLINSASLHAAPMDEILVARGCNWLETLT